MIKFIFLWGIVFFSLQSFGQRKIVIKFEHIANGKKIVLNDSTYENDYGEKYTVSKLKYYVSNINLLTAATKRKNKNIYLINANKKDSIKINASKDALYGIEFEIGVDSALNCSGAQDGALDPLNDMFWTWNSGYVNFKLEGKSENSSAINKKVEQHIGGYISAYKTIQHIYLPIPKNYFFKNNTLNIYLNLDKYWEGIKIVENAVIAAPGVLAKKVSLNFTKMFSLKNEN